MVHPAKTTIPSNFFDNRIDPMDDILGKYEKVPLVNNDFSYHSLFPTLHPKVYMNTTLAPSEKLLQRSSQISNYSTGPLS